MNNTMKNFLKGMGAVLEIFPEPPKNPVTDISDKQRLAQDWKIVGDCIMHAIKEVDSEQAKKAKD